MVRVTFLAILLFLPHILNAQIDDKYVPPTEAVWDELRARSKQIEAELATGSVPQWAGNYTWGSIGFSGATLYIAPKSGFVYRPYTDYYPNDITDKFDFGTVEQRNGSIYLHSVRHLFGDEEFQFIKWGDREHFLPVSRIPLLANLVNAGCEEFQHEKRIGTLYIPTRGSQLDAKIFGIPTIPSPFKLFFLKSAVSGKVISTGKTTIVNPFPESSTYPWRHKYTEASIDMGSQAGLWKGMLLYLKERTNVLITAQVTDVKDKSADVKIHTSYQVTNYPERGPSGPNIGWVLTSKIDKQWYYGNSTPQECW